MGNSEVGHLTLGAGRMVPQDLLRIDLALRDGSFFENPALAAAIQHAQAHGRDAPPDGPRLRRRRPLARAPPRGPPRARRAGRRAARPRPRLHGRPRHAARAPRCGYLATPRGGARASRAARSRRSRAATTRWTATSGGTAWRAPTRRSCSPRASTPTSAAEAVEAAYARDETDEFIQPTVITENGEPVGPIRDGDAVDLLQLPRGPRPADHARPDRGGVRRLPAAEASAAPLRLLHRVQERSSACRSPSRRAT